MLIQTMVIGLIAFFISGGLLVAFWRSLERESEEGGPSRLGPRSKKLLIALLASLIFFGVIFMRLGLKQ